MIVNVQHKTNRTNDANTKKKRSIIFQSYNDIKSNVEKDNKENISLNILNTPIKTKGLDMKNKLIVGRTPLISKNKKIIMFTENKYDKTLQRGKSPFFISDKISFRNEFKSAKNNNEFIKPKHLGLCDYYLKNNKNNVIPKESEADNDYSKTPRFLRQKN